MAECCKRRWKVLGEVDAIACPCCSDPQGVAKIRELLATFRANYEFAGAPKSLYRAQLGEAIRIIEHLLVQQEGVAGLLERLAVLADVAALKAETNWNPDHFEMTDDANEARALAARLREEHDGNQSDLDTCIDLCILP